MASMRIDYTAMDWTSGVPFYGPAARHDGRDIVQLKVLSDRRHDGGGIAWLVKFTPPEKFSGPLKDDCMRSSSENWRLVEEPMS